MKGWDAFRVAGVVVLGAALTIAAYMDRRRPAEPACQDSERALPVDSLMMTPADLECPRSDQRPNLVVIMDITRIVCRCPTFDAGGDK